MFKDRKEAGKKLAVRLKDYKSKDLIVLAIPKGGIEVAKEVAISLDAPFDILISRKLPLPFDPEAGFGAVAEDGSIFIFSDVYQWLSDSQISEIKKEQINEIKRRIGVLRRNRPLKNIKDKTVIIIDDGLAMGSTMRVSIELCKNKGAKKIIVAVPVAGPEVASEIEKMVDELIVIEMPEHFRAVAQVYENWYDVSDEDAIDMLEKNDIA